jgi:hypothetical protein
VKNVFSVNDKKEIHDLLSVSWKSDTFKNQSYKAPWIKENIEWFCNQPKIFCEYSDEDLERNLFYSWFHVMPLGYSHSVPLFHDLRLIHEMIHMKFRQNRYCLELNKDKWGVQIITEELTASVFTEQLVYFDDEAIRNETGMPSKIFYDQFKLRENYYKIECTDTKMAHDFLMNEIIQLKQFLGSGYLKPTNYYEEKSIWYLTNSSIWTTLFDKVFLQVESNMQKACHSGEDKNKIILDFIQSVSEDDIPYKRIQQQFQDYVDRDHKYQYEAVV